MEENGFDAGYTIDVTDYEQWRTMEKWVMKEYGRIDVFVNNAGGGISIVDTTELTKKNIDDIIALNLNSVIYGSNVFGNIMKKQHDGHLYVQDTHGQGGAYMQRQRKGWLWIGRGIRWT